MSQDFSVVCETVTAAVKMTVQQSGSLSLSTQAVLVAASGASISLASGANLTLAAGVTPTFPSIAVGAPGTASVSVATASGTTIPVAQGIVRASCTAATTSGSCTLAAGILDGQEVTVVNESANNVVISGNLKGAAAVTIAANLGQKFAWVSTDTAWFPI